MEYNPKDLSFIDNIKTIAIVGASKKRNYFFLKTFGDTFKGKVIAIKPNTIEIEGFPNISVFPNLISVPDDIKIDYVFISLPREKVAQIIDDCVEKDIKLVGIFTTNFADEGTEEGRLLQDDLLRRTKGKVNIIGPNGMGIFIPKLGIRWRSSLPIISGDIGVVAQSGGLCNLLIHGLTNENLNISKAFSIGNAVDVNVLDIINYFQNDIETNIIICYLEGIPKNTGRILLNLMKNSNKPIILLKAGKTEIGSRAAMTHTASLIGNYKLWSAAIKQGGGILVDTLSDVIDSTKYLKLVGKKQLQNICLISISGGYGVICTDNLSVNGINLPKFSEITKNSLSNLIKSAGTSFNNPIDISTLIYKPPIVRDAIKVILNDPNIDGLIFEIAPLYLAHQMNSEYNLIDELTNTLTEIKKINQKPIIVIIEDIGFNDIKEIMKNKLVKSGIPVYSDILSIIRVLKSL